MKEAGDHGGGPLGTIFECLLFPLLFLICF